MPFGIKNTIPGIISRLKVDDRGCWNWSGGLIEGYAQTAYQGRKWLGHRLVYNYLVEEIPEGMTIDHKCFNTKCMNPFHLQCVSLLENSTNSPRHRGNLEICQKGLHPFDDENTYYEPRKGKPPGRRCKACRRKANNDRYHETKVSKIS